MEAAAASAMDFHALSRRELQALCKRNGVRANMTNAAMAEALQGLTSVDGIDEIGTTLCLPTPGRSTMKSAAKVVAVAGEEQQHGSPLPRGRRVSVMSPAAIRMDVEEGEDELKRDLVKEVIKTPGVALRSTSRRARATPAPLPTPATLRRSTRTAARKAAAPVEAENLVEDVSTVKRTTRRTPARSKIMVDLDKEGEVAAATPKEQEEPKAVASDVKCEDPEEEEEVTKLLEGDNKEEELEEGEEADSSDAAIGSALPSDKSCDDCKAEQVADVVEQKAIKQQEGPVAEQEPTSVEKSAPLAPMEDSPILGVLSKDEATESVIEKEEYAPGEDGDGVDEWSPVNEMTDEINPVAEDKFVVACEEAIKEDGFTVTSGIVHSPKQILPAAAVENETSGENDLAEGKEGAADEMQQSELIEDETSEEGELDEDEEWTSDDDEASEEIDSAVESDDEIETNENNCTEVSSDLNQEKELVHMLQETGITMESSEDESAEEASDDGSDEEASDDGSDEEGSEDGSAEDDDFSSDLPPEFDNIVLSDAETESDTTLPVLVENEAALASATKSAVRSLDDSAIIEVQEVSSAEVSEEAGNEEAMKEVDNTVDTIVKSLDEFTIEEGTKETEELQKQLKFEDLHSKSLRQLKALVKGALNAKEGKKQVVAEGGKRLPLAEVDDNTGMDC